MPNEIKPKRPLIGAHTLPTVWIYICVAFNLIGVLAVTMLVIAEIIILASNFTHYVDQYGHNYPSNGYMGEAGCGYVEYTNAPKHLGSAIWMLFFQLSIVIIATLVVASDLAWRKSSYNEWGQHYVEAFYAIGIMAGTNNPTMFYYVVAKALKLFIVVLYMSQSFYGLQNGSHEYPSRPSSYDSSPQAQPNTWPSQAQTSNRPSQTQPSTWPSQNSNWRRGYGPNKSHGTELWAFWCGWIVLGSIVPSVIAFMFLVPWAAKVNEGKTSDTEKGKSGSGNGSANRNRGEGEKQRSDPEQRDRSGRSRGKPSS